MRCSFAMCFFAACSSASGQPGDAPERSPAEVPAEDRALRVEVARVGATDARIRLTLPGEVEGGRDAVLASALGGFVEQVRVDEGESVRRGQVLVRVDAALHQARAAQARVEVEAAQRELERAQGLRDAIAEAEIDRAQSRYDAAQAALRTAEVTASRTVIRAPFAGVIAQRRIEVGEVTQPGQPMLRLVQLDPAVVSLAVPDRDVVALETGMEVRVRTSTQALLEGSIARVSPVADLQTRAFRVEVEVANAEGRLLPGMIAQVDLAQPVAAGRLLVPQYVLVTRREGNGVFVAEDGIARWRPVEAGQVVRDQVVLEEGLEAGARVIVTGHRELADGDPVVVVQEGRCCPDGRVVYDEESDG